MLWSVFGPRRAGLLLASLLVATLCYTTRLAAQVAPGDTVPTRGYFTALPLYFDGDYRAAQPAFLNAGAIKSPGGRWIDSICYFTMAGECHYQLGQLPAALESYNSALKLYVAYSDWLMRVQF